MADDWHLAQINVGRFVAPTDDPRVAPFMAALDRINAIADADPGFVWRLQDDSGNATAFRPVADPLFAVNMSVWRDADALFEFVYRSAHTPVMARRRDYFERFDGAYQALWWIPTGTIPTIDEGLARLWRLDRYGPTPDAFTFKTRFPRPIGLDRRSIITPTPGVSATPDPAAAQTPSVVQAGLHGLCPRCGAKTLFAGLARFADRCPACDLDFTQFNVGDGPAAFLTLILGTIVVALAIALELTAHPPLWVHMLIWVPVTAAGVIASLRIAKGALIASEYRNRAGEGRRR